MTDLETPSHDFIESFIRKYLSESGIGIVTGCTIETKLEESKIMSDKTVCYDLNQIDLEDETNNLLLNMSGGLLPEDLSLDEIELLTNRFGSNWFTALGYSEPKHKRPKELGRVLLFKYINVKDREGKDSILSWLMDESRPPLYLDGSKASGRSFTEWVLMDLLGLVGETYVIEDSDIDPSDYTGELTFKFKSNKIKISLAEPLVVTLHPIENFIPQDDLRERYEKDRPIIMEYILDASRR